MSQIPVFVLSDGNEEIDLFDPRSLCILPDGSKSTALPLGDEPAITEQWRFSLAAQSPDGLAVKIQRLKRLINRANEFSQTGMWTRHVYIHQQGDCESNERYAFVREVSQLDFPSVFDQPARAGHVLTPVQMTLVREHPWRTKPPGQLGSTDTTVLGRPAITLGPSNGPASPQIVWVANFRDDGDVTHVFAFDDSAGTFSANLISAADGTALWPAAPAASDLHYAGSTDIAFKHVCYGLKIGAVTNWDTKLQYWSGAAWTDLTLGTEYTINRIEGGEAIDDDDFFASQDGGDFAINLFPDRLTGWAKTVINGVNAYWIRIIIVSVTSTTTLPQKNGATIYAQRTPYVEVPAASLEGDTYPLTCIRMWAPSGGDETPDKPNISRILIGAKSDSEDGVVDLDDFEPMLNAGNQDNPGAWAVTYGTDTSAVSDIGYPGGAKARTTFATDGTLTTRVMFTGTDVVQAYRGEYRVLVAFQQVGGVAGDVTMTARVFVGEELDFDPHTDILEFSSLSADLGLEVADLGLIQIPRSRVYANDPLEPLNVAIHLLAERAGGSAAVLDWAWLYLFPVQEGSVGVDDPVTDSSRGSSALRGGSYLELDNGCIANRTVKFQYHADSTISPSEEWPRFNKPIEFRNLGKRTRLYFLMEHFSTEGWAIEPLVASLGEAMAVEVFMHYRFLFLSGAA